jgi:hypothetical protein
MNETDQSNEFESTYGLVMRLEEKSRSALELVLYALSVLSVIAVIWQFAKTPVNISAPGVEPCVTCHTSAAEVRAGT